MSGYVGKEKAHDVRHFIVRQITYGRGDTTLLSRRWLARNIVFSSLNVGTHCVRIFSCSTGAQRLYIRKTA